MSDIHDDLMDGLGELEAGASSGGGRDRYGKFDIRFRWYRKGDRTETVAGPDGKEIKRVKEVKAPPDGKQKDFGSEYNVTLDTVELGDNYPYERAVNSRGPDMVHVFIPSVRKLMGQPEATLKDILKYLATLRGKYVHVIEVPSVDFDGVEVPAKKDGVITPKEEGGKQFYTPQIVEVYADKATAQAAHTARWGAKGNSNGKATSTLPYSADDWAAIEKAGYSRTQWEAMATKIKGALDKGEKVAALAAKYEVEPQYIRVLKGDDSQVPA